MKDYQFVKSVSINDLPESAWQYIVGGVSGADDTGKFMQTIPWLFRGVDIRANALANVPFSMFKGDKEIDNSEDWQNAVKILPHPKSLFSTLEAALVIFGYAYLFRERNAYITKGLRYLLPTSIKPNIQTDGSITFKRRIGNQTQLLTPEDVVYFWKQDAFVELGPPLSSPAMAAANACGVLLSVDEFAKAFFRQGAVKTTLLTTTNIAPSERDRLKTWWKRVLGMDRAWTTDIINAEKITPITIGEGLESLQNNDLTESKRIDIAAALGIPYSVLFSNASNRATAEQDDLHLYDKTILPDAYFIENILNEQVLEPLGYNIKFDPQAMPIYQEDENARAASLNQIITALGSPEEFLLAADILGYDINPDVMIKIEAMIAKKDENRAVMAELVQSKPEQEESEPEEEPEPDPEVEEPDNKALDLEKWQAKALKRFKSGRSAACAFSSEYIEPLLIASITGALEAAESENDIKSAFDSVWVGYP